VAVPPLLAPLFLVHFAAPDLVLKYGEAWRVLRRDDRGILQTAAVVFADSDSPMAPEEFRVGLSDGTILTALQSSACEVLPRDENAPGLLLRYSFDQHPISVWVEHAGCEDPPLLHKRIRAGLDSDTNPDLRVEFLDVEVFAAGWTATGPSGPIDHSSGLWASLEDPCGGRVENGPCLRDPIDRSEEPQVSGSRKVFRWSSWVVLGSRAGDGSRADLCRAVEKKARQRRIWILSRFAPAQGRTLSAALDSLLSTDGTKDLPRCIVLEPDCLARESLWTLDAALEEERRKRFVEPAGKARGRFGLSLPLSLEGLGSKVQRLEESPALKLSDPSTLKLAQRRLVDHVRNQDLDLLELVVPRCTADKLAELRGVLELVRTARALKEDLFVALKSDSVLSPWWLEEVDGLEFPLSMPELELLPVPDAGTLCLLKQIAGFVELTAQGYPQDAVRWDDPSCFVTFEGEPRGSDGLRDAAMFEVVRGTRMLDALADRGERATRSSLLKWRKSRESSWLDQRIVRGDARSGEPVGIGGGSDPSRVFFLFNPSFLPKRFRLPETGSRWLKTYPWLELLPLSENETSLTVDLEPFELCCFETLASIENLREIPEAGRFEIEQGAANDTSMALWMRPGEMHRFRFIDARTSEDRGVRGLGLKPLPGWRPCSSEPSWPDCVSSGTDERLLVRVRRLKTWRGERWTLRFILEGTSGTEVPLDHFQVSVPSTTCSSRAERWMIFEARIDRPRELEDGGWLSRVRESLALTDVIVRVDLSSIPAEQRNALRWSLTLTRSEALEPVHLSLRAPPLFARDPVLLPTPGSRTRSRTQALEIRKRVKVSSGTTPVDAEAR